MANRTILDRNPDPVSLFDELFRDIERDFKGLPLGQVRAHARARWAVSHGVICLAHMLAGSGRIPPNASFACEGAKIQDKSASEEFEAAHALPGHVLVGWSGQPRVALYEVLRNRFNRGWVERNLFGLTHRVHWLVNQADSNCENTALGFKRALADACQAAVQSGQTPAGVLAAILRPRYIAAAQRALASSEAKVTPAQRAASERPPLVTAGGAPLVPRPPDTALHRVSDAEAGANRAALRQILTVYADPSLIDPALLAATESWVAALRLNESTT